MAITSYTVVRSVSLPELIRRVNENLTNDFVPLGGLTIDQEGAYCQVMVVETV